MILRKGTLFNPCNIYLGLWSIYLLQGTLYAKGTIISQSVLLLVLLLSAFHMFVVMIQKRKPAIISCLGVLLLMFTVYGVLLLLFDGPVLRGPDGRSFSNISYLKGLYISILPVYSCYYFAAKGYMKADNLKIWVLLFFILALADYLQKQSEVVMALEMKGASGEEIVNNAGYIFLSLMPCIIIFDKKPLLQYGGLAFCVAMILLGMKRGAIVIAAVVILQFVVYKLRSASKARKILVLAVVAVGAVILARYVVSFIENSALFAARIDQTLEGSSSGRDVIYARLVNRYFEANPLQMLLGRGANGTLKIASKYAHNDWLEILTNQGLVGIIIFFVFWVEFLKLVLDKSYNMRSRIVIFMLFSIMGLKTLFSMSIGDMSIYSSSMLGYALIDGFARDEDRL